MSLLSNYFKEMKTKEIIETDNGFLTYYFTSDGLYVEDIYVSPEYRSNGLAKKMLDEVTIIAQEKGCKKILGSCIPSASNSTNSLQAAFSYGFKLHSSANNFIVYSKDI